MLHVPAERIKDEKPLPVNTLTHEHCYIPISYSADQVAKLALPAESPAYSASLAQLPLNDFDAISPVLPHNAANTEDETNDVLMSKTPPLAIEHETDEEDGSQQFAKLSFSYFRLDHPLRRACIRLVTWRWFERLSICVILINCIGLGLTDPCDFDCKTKRCKVLQHVEDTIFSFFALEMLAKMLAMGVVGKHAYLSDSWNRLDCFIVLFGTIEYIFIETDVNFSVIRAFRVLRPLRAITRIPGLRLLVTLLIDILPMLANVLVFSLFIFFVFGIIGVQLWSGVLRNRCFLTGNYTLPLPPAALPALYRTSENDFVCSPWKSGQFECSKIPLYDPQGSMCTELFDGHPAQLELCQKWIYAYSDCRPDGPNPAEGTLSFDNIGYACIAIFQVISLEGWSNILYMVQDAYSFWVWIYFTALILIGSLFAVNLCLVVIATQFSETKKRENAKMKKEKRKGNVAMSTTSVATSVTGVEELPIYNQILNLIIDTFQRMINCCQSVYTVCCKGENAKEADDKKTQDDKENAKVTLPNKKDGQQKKRNSAIQNIDSKNEKFRANLRSVLEHKLAVATIMTVILINTVAMGAEHHDQPEKFTEVMNWLNLIFTIIFAVEICLKVYAYNLSAYIRDGFNMLDLVIVIIDVIEQMYGKGSNLSVLRAFRLVRVVKLIRFMPSLQQHLLVMMKTIDSIAPFFILLSFFLYVFALLGMSLFGCRFCPQTAFRNLSLVNVTIDGKDSSHPTRCHVAAMASESAEGNNSIIRQYLTEYPLKYQDYSPAIALQQPCPRSNFDSLLFSLLTVLQVFTQDAWSEILENGMRNTSDYASIYFIVLVTVGNYVIFNLLVAILVEGFSNEHDRNGDAKAFVEEYRKKLIKEKNEELRREEGLLPPPASVPTITVENYDDPTEEVVIIHGPMVDYDPVQNQAAVSRCPRISSLFHVQSAALKKFASDRASYSLFLFPPENRFREALETITNNPAFDNVVLFFIVANCIVIGVERPSIPDGSIERTSIDTANHVFTVIFLVEATIKIIAKGLVFGETSYLRNGWNVLDFLLVICSTIHTMISLLSTSLLSDKTRVFDLFRVLRILRALRPLRVVNRSHGLKVAVETLVVSIKPIGFIVVITVSFFLVFAVLGLQLFRGCFHRCEIPQTNHSVVDQGRNYTTAIPDHGFQLLSTVKTKQDCLTVGLEWSSSSFNFDNIANALMSLFVFATFDGWVDITRDGVDCVGIDKQPIKDYNLWRLLYFISFLLIVCFFMLNMFVGVVVNNFQKVQKRVTAEQNERRQQIRRDKLLARLAAKGKLKAMSSITSNSQATFNDSQRSKFRNTVRIKTGQQKKDNKRRRSKMSTAEGEEHDKAVAYFMKYPPWRKFVFKAVNNRWFDMMISLATVVTLIAMGIEHYGISPRVVRIIRLIGYTFTGLIVSEVIVKFIAFGPRNYFKSRWNQMDLFITVSTIIGIIVEQFIYDINPTIIQLFRIFRIIRVFKVLKSATGIQKLLKTVSNALPQVGNLSILFLLLFFIYAAVGVELFGKFECNYITCEGLSRHANFHNAGMSMLTLFRIFTGDDWNDILRDALTFSSDENCPFAADGGLQCTIIQILSPIYFISFVLISQFILINVVIAVLMSQLEETNYFPKLDEHQISREVTEKVAALEDVIEHTCPDMVERLQECLHSSRGEVVSIISTEYALRHSLESPAEDALQAWNSDDAESLHCVNSSVRSVSADSHASMLVQIDRSALVEAFHSVTSEMEKLAKNESIDKLPVNVINLFVELNSDPLARSQSVRHHQRPIRLRRNRISRKIVRTKSEPYVTSFLKGKRKDDDSPHDSN